MGLDARIGFKQKGRIPRSGRADDLHAQNIQKASIFSVRLLAVTAGRRGQGHMFK